jgi:hypothetical protein
MPHAMMSHGVDNACQPKLESDRPGNSLARIAEAMGVRRTSLERR